MSPEKALICGSLPFGDIQISAIELALGLKLVVIGRRKHFRKQHRMFRPRER